MKIEHFAVNVADPDGMAGWYVKNLGMHVARHVGGPNHTFFLADTGDHSLIEIYHNPAAPVPDYASLDPLILHIAFVVQDMAATVERLVAAGATRQGDIGTTPAGDQLAMLRDPWGLAIQLARRAKPLISQE